jgi:hypothetical protein
MKKIIPLILITLYSLGLSFLSGSGKKTDTLNNIVVQFITSNRQSNTLYIDNFSIGNKFDYDVAPLSVNNILRDTSYVINGNNPFNIAPKVSFLNAGKLNITTPFNVYLQVTPGNYNSTKQIGVLNNHRAVEITFDSLTITPGTQYFIKTWSSLDSDQNRSNDTLSKHSLYLPGARRNVLFEAYTNVSCPPCGTNNPYLDTFIVARFDTIVAIKYHTWWPATSDPMYTPNPQQINYRINYYPINNVPVLNVDGVYLNIYPYTRLSNMLSPYSSRLSNGSPLGLSVVDTRIAPDTISAAVTLNIYSPLPSGIYKMRLNAIERHIHYQNPPGSNGEKDFYDVFRRMYPDTSGILINTAPGVYNYTIKYQRNSAWVDSMIYSAVYVQNETTKEVFNSAKARHTADNKFNFVNTKINNSFGSKIKGVNIKNKFNSKYNIDTGSSVFYFDAFENEFPPSGWTITNTDNVNFSQSNLASGPTLGGTKSIVMLLQSANGTSTSYHYLISHVFNSINLTDSIKFDWAYAPYGGESVEGLKVQVSTDGGYSFPFTIFNRIGSQLATAPATGESFIPSDSSQWRTFSVCLNSVIGIKKISDNVPDKFTLFQNYPNPFNPATIINYQLPMSVNVKLTIYDMLGREISILVNEKQQPGTYQVEWNGANFASGIYFYKLEAGDFKKTKRMVLIK